MVSPCGCAAWRKLGEGGLVLVGDSFLATGLAERGAAVPS
jgi:hypothetical protein